MTVQTAPVLLTEPPIDAATLEAETRDNVRPKPVHPDKAEREHMFTFPYPEGWAK